VGAALAMQLAGMPRRKLSLRRWFQRGREPG